MEWGPEPKYFSGSVTDAGVTQNIHEFVEAELEPRHFAQNRRCRDNLPGAGVLAGDKVCTRNQTSSKFLTSIPADEDTTLPPEDTSDDTALKLLIVLVIDFAHCHLTAGQISALIVMLSRRKWTP